MIQTVLGIATLLGGIAAVWFFWDKIGEYTRFDQLFGRLEPATPISESSVFAYGNGNKRLWSFTNRIASTRGFEVRNVDAESAWLNERIAKFGIKTVRELDSYVRKYGEYAVQLTNHFTPQQAIDNWFILELVLDIAAIEKNGLEGIRALRRDLQFSTGDESWAERIFDYYEQIKKHR